MTRLTFKIKLQNHKSKPRFSMSSKKARTRLLRVGSHDATSWASNSEFEIDIGNSIRELQVGIRGVSIDAVGFKNSIPNVRPYSNISEPNGAVLKLAAFFGGAPSNIFPGPTNVLEIAVPQAWYSAADLAAYIRTQLDALWDPAGTSGLTCTVDPVPGLSYDSRVSFLLFPSSPTVDEVRLIGNSKEATVPAYLGWPLDHSRIGDYVLGATVDNVIAAPFGPNCQGDGSVFLHSSILAYGQEAIDGEGRMTGAITAIPITVQYDINQTYAPNQLERPSIIYSTRQSIRRVNFTLRDIRGNSLNIGTGELWVLLRLWL